MEPWASWKDYFEIVWFKFSSQPINAEFIQLVYSAMADIPVHDPGLVKEYLKMVVRMIVEFEADHQLANELLRILELKYRDVLDIGQFTGQLYVLRVLARRPRSSEERVAFLRACRVSLDPDQLTED
jgi:hypothetical protein